jgi:tetratricopeptide (TPR) repeat protein
MKVWSRLHNTLVAATLPLILCAGVAFGQTAKLDGLFDKLKTADAQAAARIEQEIWIEWSKSGSAAMDLLLERGRSAMAEGNLGLAVEHFTALIDHAPEFAEGYNARATAYYQMGQIGPSMADIARTLKLNPRHFGALSGFAMILEELDRPEQALEVQKAVQAIHPHAAGISEAIDRLEAGLEGRSL